MSVETDFDRLEMLDVNEWGTSVTLVLGSTEKEVVGIFDDAHFVVDNGLTIISTSEPQLHVRTSDVTDVILETVVRVNGSTFSVSDIQPDGTGLTLLRLHKT